MNYLLFLLLISFYTGLIGYTLFRLIGKGDASYLIWLIILLFPVYTHVLSVTYMVTGSRILVNIIRASKDIVFYLALLAFFLFQPNPLTKKYRFVTLDYLFILFFGLAFMYMLLPFGEATLVNKVVYFKNMSFMGIAYFIGRNSFLDGKTIIKTGHVIIWIALIAFVVGLGEKLTDTHLHTLTGYGKYHEDISEIDPSGNYGLTWTFEASDGKKRFGSIFSNPLEYAASMLIVVAVVFILFIRSTYVINRFLYTLAGIVVLFNVFFAYSRSSMLAVFVVLLFIAFHQRYYKLIGAVFGAFLMVVFYIFSFAEEDTKYFFIDTVLFQESSALGHAIEWANALESIVENPMGIGLATSGNASGVDDELHVGGENQFLIYGVQMGVIGTVLYILITCVTIYQCFVISRFKLPITDIFIPFVAGVTRFGLLLPMLTANAEIYSFVSLTSWFFVGIAMQKVK